MRILVLNSGSSSLKYEVFDLGEGAERSLAGGLIEGIGEPSGAMHAVVQTPDGPQTEDVEQPFEDHHTGMAAVMDHLSTRGLLRGLSAVGHR
ncbi:MAG TPA: hypothetical protein VMM13_13260, partial [Euzebya sp.]|nr:hypothetical protein [Euzebya sp.]